MPLFLDHFVFCGWSPCYNTIFARVILPHLNQTSILDLFLRSGAIQERGNTIKAPNGASIYYDLFKYLMNVKSDDIKAYLQQQFPEYFQFFKAVPFVFWREVHWNIRISLPKWIYSGRTPTELRYPGRKEGQNKWGIISRFRPPHPFIFLDIFSVYLVLN